MLERIFSRTKARSAVRKLSSDPSPGNYVELAQAKISMGRLDEVLRICEEGLSIHAGDATLDRMLIRVRKLLRDDRMRELRRDLKSSPRPALWRELSELYLAAGHVDRAEEIAAEWHAATQSGDALLHRARARMERFLADRRRDDGRMAFHLIDQAIEALPGDVEPLRMRQVLASRCGAWVEARRSIARLLELLPGDPSLEARFRTIASLADKGGDLDQALREVERTGRLADDECEGEIECNEPSAKIVRPRLQELAAAENVRAAFYVRGGTALVQGPKGATAERTARCVRELVASGRTAARRLGLGQVKQIVLEGGFGTFFAATSEMSAGAVWSAGRPTRRQRGAVIDLCEDANRGGTQA